MLSHVNLLPIQKINKYIFGSKRKKGGKRPLATVWIMDYGCQGGSKEGDGGNARGPWVGIFSTTLQVRTVGLREGKCRTPNHSVDVEDGLAGRQVC